MGKYIDADNAIKRLGAYLMTYAQIEYGGLASEDIEDWKPLATNILKGAPSIDIVRCKECRRWATKHFEDGYGWCEHHINETTADDFCSYGERSEP